MRLMKIKEKYKNIPTPVKASLAFTFASFLTKGLNIITTPIFTRIMSTAQMGVVTTYMSWTALIGIFANLALDSGSFNIAMMEFKDRRDGYISSVLTLSTLTSMITAGIYFLFSDYWIAALGLSHNLICLMLTGFLFLPATSYWMCRQRYEYNYKSTISVSIASTVLSSVIAVAAILLFSKKTPSILGEVRLIAANSVLILIGIIFFIYIMMRGRIFYCKEYWLFALRINLPLLVHTLAKQILDASDRIMISAMIGKSAVGIYGVLYSVSTLSLIIWNSINSSMIPYMFGKLEKKRDKEINKIVAPMILAYGVICIFMTLVSPEIVKILATKEYYEAIYMMPPVAGGIFLTALYNTFSNVLLFYKKTKHIMISTVIAAITNIMLNYLFIPKYGYIAAAYATLAAYIILALFQFLSLQYVSKGRRIFSNRFIWFIACIVICCCLFCNLLYKHTAIRYSIAALFGMLICVGVKKVKSIYQSMR